MHLPFGHRNLSFVHVALPVHTVWERRRTPGKQTIISDADVRRGRQIITKQFVGVIVRALGPSVAPVRRVNQLAVAALDEIACEQPNARAVRLDRRPVTTTRGIASCAAFVGHGGVSTRAKSESAAFSVSGPLGYRRIVQGSPPLATSQLYAGNMTTASNLESINDRTV